MRVHCTKCGAQQQAAERACLKCGEALGGERWVLVTGLGLAVWLPLIVGLSDDPLSRPDLLKLLLWYELPVLVGTAFLFDYHPRRRAIYFWGGCVAIVASLVLLYGR